MAELTDFLKATVQSGASDLHLVVGKPPLARINGLMQPMQGVAALNAEETERLIYSVLTEAQRASFEEHWELDGSVSIPGASRFRLNAFRQKNGAGAVFRAIPTKIPTPQEIGLMPAIANLIDLPRGLVLVTGPTGSGKSTTLATMIEQINIKSQKKILTIEDPIEFVYEDKNSVVLQREVGTSTQSFAEALRHAMRQDPDVILIGEMRDLETIQLAITAAETGHLCFGTLHTQDAPSTIDRIIDVFPSGQQAQVRLQVSTVLQAVVCQQLLPRKGGGRVCAREFLRVTSGVASLIREGKTHQIYGAMEAGAKHGMIAMDQYLAFLIKQGLVEPDEALSVAHDAATVRGLAGMAVSAAPPRRMIVARLRRALAAKASDWAKAEGLTLPAALPLAPAPPHVKADLSLPWPLAVAKAAKRNPLELAKSLAAALSEVPEVESATASPPGFVNVVVRNTALVANLKAITLSPKLYGKEENGTTKKTIIEFVSANPTGPLHMASGRGATLGDSLVRVMRRLGRTVAAEYYVNDGGDRVLLLGESILARYKQSKGEDAQVPEKGYQGDYLIDLAKAAPAECAGWTALQWGTYAKEALLASHKDDMKVFDVTFDRWYLESELFASGKVPATLEYLKKRGMVFEKDGAVWLGTLNAEGSTDDKDRVLVKSTGKPTYFLPDIAYHKDKYDRGFDRVIDIFGADHHGYVPRMRAAIAALGKDPESYHAIVHQLIHLFRGAESVKMSKRAGTFISLREIIDEVGKDACRFFFALRTPDSHLNFDLELAKKQSSENPVFYVQYVHARICSIFRKADEAGLQKAGAELPMPNALFLTAPDERALLLKLAWFPEVLLDAEKVLSPHPLANYLMELAGLFHPFYEHCPVVTSSDPEVAKARLLLIAGVRDAIREGLDLLGVSAPDQM